MIVQTERSITNSILKALNGRDGCYARKLFGGGSGAGWPDVLCVFRGQVFFLEVKRPGGRLSLLQQRELDRWRSAGSCSEVVQSASEATRVVFEGWRPPIDRFVA